VDAGAGLALALSRRRYVATPAWSAGRAVCGFAAWAVAGLLASGRYRHPLGELLPA